MKRYLLVGAGLLVLIGILVGIKVAQIGKLMAMGKAMQQSGPPPEAVGSAVAQSQTWEATISAVGSISGLRNVAVSNEVPGTVSKIKFESGQIAKEGQILIELDADVERAQLASAESRRELAGKTAQRSKVLAQGNVISRSQLDEVESQLKSATTDMAALRAQVERKVIRAPFPGRLGIRAVNVGQYLTPGTTVTTLDAMGGTFVDFTLPQEELAAAAVGLPVRATIEGTKEALQGTISAIDPTVDLATRNVKVRAAIPEPQTKPRPGMFVTVEVVKPPEGGRGVGAGDRDRARVVRRFAVRPRGQEARVAGHGQDAGRQAGEDRPPAVRAPRGQRAATSSRSPRASRRARRW